MSRKREETGGESQAGAVIRRRQEREHPRRVHGVHLAPERLYKDTSPHGSTVYHPGGRFNAKALRLRVRGGASSPLRLVDRPWSPVALQHPCGPRCLAVNGHRRLRFYSFATFSSPLRSKRRSVRHRCPWTGRCREIRGWRKRSRCPLHPGRVTLPYL